MYPYVKRFFDIVLSVLGLLISSPLLLIVVVIIKLDSPGPVLFKQTRVGYNKQPFSIYKFRTMRIESPSNTPSWMFIDPELYITKVGQFLRKTSIDELPQLINIIKGDMSIIGPRPVIETEHKLISARYREGAYNVLPGLTGLAQINGRDKVSPLEKARFDGIYAKNISMIFDCKIFIATIAYVLRMGDVVEGTIATTNLTEPEKNI